MTVLDTTAEKFRGLVNLYTGEPMVVKMAVPKAGSPLFFAPGTYTHAEHWPTAEQALDAWDRENGVSGLKDRAHPVCPYTGETLALQSDAAGFFFEGGFDPRRLMPGDEFVYYASMRGSKASRPRPDTCRVESPSEDFGGPRGDGETLEPTDEARKIAETVVEAHKDRVGLKKERTVVSMSTGRRRR